MLRTRCPIVLDRDLEADRELRGVTSVIGALTDNPAHLTALVLLVPLNEYVNSRAVEVEALDHVIPRRTPAIQTRATLVAEWFVR